MDIAAPAADARKHGHKLGQSRGFCWFARAGIAARGAVYIVIGVLAVKLALGDRVQRALLVVVAIGLAGYASWRLLRAALGGTQGADDLKDRIDGLASGISYAILCGAAVKILAGSGGGGSDPDKTAGGVLGWPCGPWLVGLTGLIVIGVGLQQGYKGISRSFMENTDTNRMHDHVERGYTALGVFGHLARMVVFGLIGYFLVKAALDFDPDKAVALDGALAKLANAPYGPVLLGIVAAGLVGFGAFSLVESRYRRV